jgi:hypothetical protein
MILRVLKIIKTRNYVKPSSKSVPLNVCTLSDHGFSRNKKIASTMTRNLKFKTKGGTHNSAGANASSNYLMFKRHDSQLIIIYTEY